MRAAAMIAAMVSISLPADFTVVLVAMLSAFAFEVDVSFVQVVAVESVALRRMAENVAAEILDFDVDAVFKSDVLGRWLVLIGAPSFTKSVELISKINGDSLLEDPLLMLVSFSFERY